MLTPHPHVLDRIIIIIISVCGYMQRTPRASKLAAASFWWPMSTRTGQQSVHSQSTETAGAESFSLSSLGVAFRSRFSHGVDRSTTYLGVFAIAGEPSGNRARGALGFAYLWPFWLVVCLVSLLAISMWIELPLLFFYETMLSFALLSCLFSSYWLSWFIPSSLPHS